MPLIKPRLIARQLSKAATRFIGQHWGESFPFYYVSEYPKSGGTWLAQMVGDYLQVPFPQYSIFPIGCEAVILNHWPYDHRLRRVFYIYRDGRDVMTSLFFHRIRIASDPCHPASDVVRRHLDELAGEDHALRERDWLLARFLEHEFRHPGLGSRLHWAHHISEWYAPGDREHIAYLSYEELLRDTPGTLARVLGQITDHPTDIERARQTAAKFSMQAQTGRRPGEEDARNHVRKGIAGDWNNHFNRECAEIFHAFAGETLIALGYEADEDWVERVGANAEAGQ